MKNLLLLIPLVAFAAGIPPQFVSVPDGPVGAGPGGSWSPTNNSDGTYPMGWWAFNHLTTNSGNAILPNLNSTNSIGNLTNSTAANFPHAGTRNGNATGRFFTDKFLRAGSGFATATQPIEIFFAVALTNSNGGRIVTSGSGSPSYRMQTLLTGNFSAISGVSQINAVPAVTNTWAIYSIYFSGASSTIYTNNVLALTGTLGTEGFLALGVGRREANGDNYGQFEMMEMLIYTNQCPSTVSESARSNVWYYLKTNAGL